MRGLFRFLVILLVVAFGGCERTPTPTPYAVIVLDTSGSAPEAQCEIASALAEEAFGTRGNKRESKLLILRTGGDRSAMEPVELATYRYPYSNKALEGRGAVERQTAEAVDQVFFDCQARVVAEDISPIFIAVKRGAEHLQARGCVLPGDCTLWVQTDGQETFEQAVGQAMGTLKKKGDPEMPSSIDNDGISVRFCGHSETVGVPKGSPQQRYTANRTASKADQVQATWKGLFTEPDLVVFDPICPKRRAPEEGVVPGLSDISDAQGEETS